MWFRQGSLMASVTQKVRADGRGSWLLHNLPSRSPTDSPALLPQHIALLFTVCFPTDDQT